jgi:integrase
MVSIRSKMAERSGSKVPQFRVRVPANVLQALRGRKILLFLSDRAGPPFIKTATIGQEVQFSLGTTDAYVAEARQNDALDHLRRLFDLTASQPSNLSHKDLTALSGEVYRAYVAINEADPGEPLDWRMHKALHRATMEGRIANPPPAVLATGDSGTAEGIFGTGDLTAAVDALPAGQHDGLEDRFGLLADWTLIRHRIHLAPTDRRHFLQLVGMASLDAGWQLRRNAEGDYSPDAKAGRFPPVESIATVKPQQTITGLFESWWKEAQKTGRSERTHDAYEGAIDRLVKFLKHDDARRVTADDMLRFKDDRLQTVSAKTFKDGDMPGINSVFGWAVDNRKLISNPASAIKVKAAKKVRERSPAFSDDEAKAILRACLSYTRKPKEDAKTAAAKRWGPLIAAYTGCRIAEALQLRKIDIRDESGRHIIDFNPSAGTIKSGEFRLVPFHEHLIDLGFITFVEQSSDGPLFAKGSYKRVVDFVRTVVTDKRVQPNHGWRHRLKSVTRDLGLDPRVVDAIQDHAPRTAGENYGDVSIRAMGHVIDALPRISDAPD